METYIYAGFLSYAHADEIVAAKLHHALETYKIPKGQSGKLSPIFRDTDELTAHHSLSEKIRGAVTGSRVLIVLCSPAAKASHWVNEEIRLFRELHGEASILCVLAEGTPETAFPPALLEGGREPLAANLGRSKESFRLGVTQIAAAMLGVGLDTLIQRETRRKRRRLQAVTAGALIFSTFMGATTFSAVTARKEADANRMQAEGLVEYMITDLKEKLEPVGRLDILDSIGDRAVEYYDAQDISKLPDDSLARQARARHILGKVSLDAGKYDEAQAEIEAAANLTQEIYDRNPDDTSAIFDHAQSEYWVGTVFVYQKQYDAAMPFMKKYAALSEHLHKIDPNNLDWNMERAWSANNIGLLEYRLGNDEAALTSYLKGASYFENALRLSPDNSNIQFELANVWAGLANISAKRGEGAVALTYRRNQIRIYQSILERTPDNFKLKYRLVRAKETVFRTNMPDLEENEALEILDFCFKEYDTLIAYDPKNKKWQEAYKQLITFLSENQENFQLGNLETLNLRARIKSLQDL